MLSYEGGARSGIRALGLGRSVEDDMAAVQREVESEKVKVKVIGGVSEHLTFDPTPGARYARSATSSRPAIDCWERVGRRVWSNVGHALAALGLTAAVFMAHVARGPA